MKNWIRKSGMLVLILVGALMFGATVQAKEQDTIKTGVYAGDIDLSGKNRIEATAAIEGYINDLSQVEITLQAANNKEVKVTAADLGIAWANPDLIEEALELGEQGNIIQRYKTLKDLEHENHVYDIELNFDIQAINDIIAGKCTKYDQEAVDVSLKRENGVFTVVDGQIGYVLDVETSIDRVYDYLTGEWDHKPTSIALDVVVSQPKGSAEELAVVSDVLGSYTTSFASSGAARVGNVTNGCNLINGITLYPGEEFSALEAVTPFTEANGYYMAASYASGKVVDSLGGGICQVTTTLYNAVLLSELEISQRHNHSMIVAYVSPAADAAIAESAGKDFCFVNNTEHPIYIEGIIKGRNITFNIYGKEYRDANRTVTYESEVIEVINPSADVITADAAQPIGYFVKESAHIGYKAKLWKVVKENGVEVSREEVNYSTYKMTPRYATVGTATADPNAYNEITAAIATSNIDHVQNVVAYLTTPVVVEESEEE